MRKAIYEFDVLFDSTAVVGQKKKNISSIEYFGDYVRAEDKPLANLTVREWLVDELKEKYKDVRMTYKNIYVDGKVAYGNFRVKEKESGTDRKKAA